MIPATGRILTRDYFALAAFSPGVRGDDAVLEDYVQELARLYDLPAAELRRRFHRFLDIYHRRTAQGTDEEWARIHTGDLEHSFIRISKPYRFRSADMVPEALRVIQRSLKPTASRLSLLEFGGGFGNDAIVYARCGFEAHYADLVSLRNTDIVTRRFAMRGLDIPVHDVGALPFRRFDVITAMDVLEHVYDIEETTAQLAARIRTEGILCCANAFGAISYDGDHYDKNRVYVAIFDELMLAAGFELVPTNLPLTAYRRIRSPEPDVRDELTRLRPLLYAATQTHARRQCEQLLAAFPHSQLVDWAQLPLERSLASNAEVPAGHSRLDTLRAHAYQSAAKRAPRALKQGMAQRQLARVTAELTDASNPAQGLGALADWVSVLRIAEHRLHALVRLESEDGH